VQLERKAKRLQKQLQLVWFMHGYERFVDD
jgi:hypothetical protein